MGLISEHLDMQGFQLGQYAPFVVGLIERLFPQALISEIMPWLTTIIIDRACAAPVSHQSFQPSIFQTPASTILIQSMRVFGNVT